MQETRPLEKLWGKSKSYNRISLNTNSWCRIDVCGEIESRYCVVLNLGILFFKNIMDVLNVLLICRLKMIITFFKCTWLKLICQKPCGILQIP